jgi:hypothetical protein
MNALRGWLREREQDGSDYLFTSPKGCRLDHTQFFRISRPWPELRAHRWKRGTLTS